MSCGSTPSRTYFVANKPACAATGGPCLPCPASGTHYQEGVFKNAAPTCNITTSNLSADQIAARIGLVLSGAASAPTRAQGDADGVLLAGPTTGVDLFSAALVDFVTFGQTGAGATVVCSLVGECESSLLSPRYLDSTTDFADLAAGSGVDNTILTVNMKDGTTSAISRAEAVGASGFFSA